ncbi:MAG: 2-amino-4-hydroxy-6-hydroxymethyldihydropteridine diphosphokinase [Herminiimonas sp.]|nr:2-amino-4-hydroxy-6-hydroxymethyldihydropteridine diphosphokinase [Herminiimonas sp.]
MHAGASIPAPAPPQLAYIGIGANLGDALDNVAQAFTALATLPTTRITTRSSLYRTAPVDADGDDYINAVACIETLLTPTALLDALLAIEQVRGRTRSYRNAPRPLDLDILLFGVLQLQTEMLTIPHPRLTQRAFVLVPLLEIAPAIDIPGLGPARAFAPMLAGQAIRKITV